MRRSWVLAVMGTVVVVAALFLAVFPTNEYLSQRSERQRTEADLQRLEAQNKALEARAGQLHTDAEIERVAREQYNLVRPGEEAYAILPPRQQATPPRGPREQEDKSWWARAWGTVTSIF